MICIFFLALICGAGVSIGVITFANRRDIAYCEELGCNVIERPGGQWEPL